ncbi:hypothetical protein [Paractinoplanes globisporus]|uniref:Annexin n=1 Tax=Paractinoplanes globisporus TaxID=113565 RepID=A0ABW6W8H1_9ACTN|nr:hypothetical protein [Actinoplanes globisporus]
MPGAAVGEAAPATIEQWHATTRRAADALPHPAVSGTPGAREIASTGQSAADHQARIAGAAPHAAARQVPPHPRTPPTPAPPPDPVPEATRVVREAAAARLPPIALPALQATPSGRMPVLGPSGIADLTAARQQLRTVVAPPVRPARQPSRTERPAVAAEPPVTAAPAPARIEDIRLEALGELPAPLLAEATQVIDGLRAGLPGMAADALRLARLAAYREGALAKSEEYHNYNDDTLVPELTAGYTGQVDELAASVGYTDRYLHSAAAERHTRLTATRRAAATSQQGAATDAAATARQAAERTAVVIGEARRDAERETRKRLRTAMTSTDPALILDVRDELLGRARAGAADAAVAHERARDQRLAQVDDYERRYTEAYEAADSADVRVLPTGGLDVNRTPDGRPWLSVQSARIAAAMTALRTDTRESADLLIAAAWAAGGQAAALVRDWAAERTGDLRDDDRRRLDAAVDAVDLSRERVAAEARATAEQSRDQLLLDVLVMRAAVARQSAATAAEAAEQDAGLAKIASAAGTTAESQLAFLVRQSRDRIVAAGQDGLVQRLRSDIEAVTPTPDNYHPLDLILFAGTGRNAVDIAEQVHDAVDRIGTEEQQIYDALANLTRPQAAVVRAAYLKGHGETIEEAIKDDMSSGSERDRALALAHGDAASAAAARLHEAMDGPGTAEREVYATLRALPPDQRAEVARRYREMYDETLDAALKDDFEDQELERAQALAAGDTDRADALALDEAVLGHDVAAMEEVHKQIRDEVGAAHPEYSSRQVEAEVRRRTAGVEVSYDVRFAGAARTLVSAYQDNLTGPVRDLAEALRTNDLVGADAARFAVYGQRAEAGGTEADTQLNEVMRGRYERILDSVRRDEEPALRRAFGDQMRIAAEQGSPMTPQQQAIAERNIQVELEKKARERSRDQMSVLERRFDDHYSQTWGATQSVDSGEGPRIIETPGEYGGLRTLIEQRGREESRTRYETGGYLTAAQEVRFAVTGPGTDEDRIRRVLRGRTREEINEILGEYQKTYHEDMKGRLEYETDPGTRDRFDFGEMLVGLPRNEHEQWQAIERRHQFESTTYGLGGAFEVSPEQRRILDDEYERSKVAYQRITDPEHKPDAEELERYRYEFAGVATRYDAAAEAYRRGVDHVTDVITQIVGAVVTVVAALVITAAVVASGGTAAPAAIALVASLLGTLATMTTRAILLGNQYGLEDIAHDAAMGVVDAALAAATAGLGEKLLVVAKGAPPGLLARMAQTGGTAAKLTAKAAAEVVEQAAQAGPQALAATLLDDNTYRGDVLKNIVEGTVRQGAINLATGVAAGAVMRVGMHVGGAALGEMRAAWRSVRGKPPLDAVTVLATAPELAAERAARPGRPADILELRGNPAQRAAAFREFRGQYPNASYREFLTALDRGLTEVQISADADQLLRKQMRGELLTVIPPELRGRFARTPIEVISDADFAAHTRSGSGYAVVEFHNGEPRVIVRETAPPGTLLREGAHLWQSVDPATADLITKVDQSVLGRWDSLTVAEKMELYRAKLDLEIDAHQRTIAIFEGRLAAPELPPQGKLVLSRELNTDLATLRALREIHEGVRALSPDDIARIGRGELHSPVDLNQPARLFSKSPPPGTGIPKDEIVEIFDSPQLWRASGPAERVYQIGDTEPLTDRKAQSPYYRDIIVIEKNGWRWHTEENWTPEDYWVQSGSERERAGRNLEVAARAEAAGRAASPPPGMKAYHYFEPTRIAREGFDLVGIAVQHDDTVRVELIEVKRSKKLKTEEFTAVRENFQKNLDTIREDLDAMNERLRTNPDAPSEGMSQQTIRAALDAIDDKRIDLRVVIGPNSKVGPTGNKRSLLDGLVESVRNSLGEGADVRPVILDRIHESRLATIERDEALAILGTPEQRLAVMAERNLAIGPDGLREARAVLREEGRSLPGPARRSERDGVVYCDSEGNPVHVRVIDPKAFSAAAAAREILGDLAVRVPHETDPGSLVTRKVVVDVSELTPAQLRALKQAVSRQAARAETPSVTAAIIWGVK